MCLDLLQLNNFSLLLFSNPKPVVIQFSLICDLVLSFFQFRIPSCRRAFTFVNSWSSSAAQFDENVKYKAARLWIQAFHHSSSKYWTEQPKSSHILKHKYAFHIKLWNILSGHSNPCCYCSFKFPSSPQIPMQYQAMQSMKMLQVPSTTKYQGPSTAQYRGIKSTKMFQEPDVTDDATNSAAAQWKLKTKVGFNIPQAQQCRNTGYQFRVLLTLPSNWSSEFPSWPISCQSGTKPSIVLH